MPHKTGNILTSFKKWLMYYLFWVPQTKRDFTEAVDSMWLVEFLALRRL